MFPPGPWNNKTRPEGKSSRPSAELANVVFVPPSLPPSPRSVPRPSPPHPPPSLPSSLLSNPLSRPTPSRSYGNPNNRSASSALHVGSKRQPCPGLHSQSLAKRKKLVAPRQCRMNSSAHARKAYTEIMQLLAFRIRNLEIYRMQACICAEQCPAIQIWLLIPIHPQAKDEVHRLNLETGYRGVSESKVLQHFGRAVDAPHITIHKIGANSVAGLEPLLPGLQERACKVFLQASPPRR